jgi:predicted DsbA family dithiol-disulfide isomerase
VEAVLYTDLNCPFCYATEQRLEALGVQDRVEWRGVEHEPDLPVPMLRDDAELNEEVAGEVDQVKTRAPEVAIARPGGKPNTARAILAAAAAERVDRDRARAYRQAIYRAFWVDGADVSQPEVLEALARDHGLASIEPHPDDDLRVTTWRLDWERSPLRGVPLLVRSDGEILYGLKDSQTLAQFMGAG